MLEFWRRLIPGNVHTPPIVSALMPQDKRSKLEIARDLLATDDKEIISLLSHFDAARTPKIYPNPVDLASYMDAFPFPDKIETIAIQAGMPISLIAGVAQFLTRESIGKNPDKFEQLAQKLATRFKHAWLVVEHKTENHADFSDENGFINGFVEKQHNNVLNRANTLAKNVAAKKSGLLAKIHYDVLGGAVAPANENYEGNREFNTLSENVINFIAATGAGWQTEGMNNRTGPYSTKQLHHDHVFKTFPSYPKELNAG